MIRPDFPVPSCTVPRGPFFSGSRPKWKTEIPVDTVGLTEDFFKFALRPWYVRLWHKITGKYRT